MRKTVDELTQDFINELSQNRSQGVTFSDYSKKSGISSLQWIEITNNLEEIKCIVKSPHGDKFYILPKGEQFVNGEYLKLQMKIANEKEIAIQNNSINEERTNKKLDLDITEAKRKNKWFYPKLIVAFIGVFLAILTAYDKFFNEKQSVIAIKENPSDLNFKIFKNDSLSNDFGYDIFVDEKLYIHQPTIPGISGKKGFKSESDAKKVAELAKNKIERTHSLPTITLKELDSLGIKK